MSFETKRQIASGGGGAGVDSLNGLTGAVSLVVGSGVSLNTVGNDIEISANINGISGQVAYFNSTDAVTSNANLRYDDTIGQLITGTPSVLEGIAEIPLVISGENGSYIAANLINTDATGSGDIVVSADNDDGTIETGHYLDIGINNSNYTPNSPFEVGGPDDGFITMINGNLTIQAASPGKVITFTTAGDTTDQVRLKVEDTRTSIFANKNGQLAPDLEALDWTATGGWSAGSGQLVLVSDPGTSTIEPAVALTITPGVTYQIIIESTGNVGNVTYTLGGVNGSQIIDGTNTDYITADTSGNFILTGDPTAESTITSISIRELIDNTGDLFVEGNLILGSSVTTIGDHVVMDVAGDGTVEFPLFPLLPNSYPTNDLEATNKAYVDNLVTSGARFVGNVRVATTTTLPAYTYNNGTLGVGATITANANGALPTIDGETLVNGDILLVKDESNAEYNGAYEVTSVGSGGSPFVLTRITAYDTASEIVTGTFFTVLEGTVNSLKQFSMITSGTITVGTTDINFAQLSAPIVYTASNGVQLSGNNFSAKLNAQGAIGLGGVGTDELKTNVDNTTIEISSNQLQLKDLGVSTGKLANQAVTFAKMQNITTQRLVGRTTAGSGSPEEIAISSGLTLSGGFLRNNSQTFVTTSSFTKTSDTTLAAVPGLTIDVEAGATYNFEATLYTTSINTAGVRASFNGTCTTSMFIAEGWVTNTTPAAKTRVTTLGTVTAALTAATVATIRLSGSMTVNTGGSFHVRFAQNVSQATGSVVLPGSSFTVTKV